MADVRQISGVEARTGGIVDVNGAWTTLQKRNKKGQLSKKAKTSVNIEADPLVLRPDAKGAAALYAAVVADEIKRQLGAIGETVSAATVERRRRYQRDGQSASYRKRYANTTNRGSSGLTASRTGFDRARGAGRTTGAGPMAPVVSYRWGSDSGRLGEVSVRVRKTSQGAAVATINVPANRLDPLLFSANLADFERFRDKLIQLAPIFGGRISADATTRARVGKVVKKIADDALAVDLKEFERLVRERRRLVAQILADATGFGLLGDLAKVL